MLDLFALAVILIIAAVGIWLVLLIGHIPGDMARKISHPQSDAITMLAWVGLLTGGVGWLAALVWCRVKVTPAQQVLEQRVGELEAKLALPEATQ